MATCYSCGRDLVHVNTHGLSFDGCFDCPVHPDAIVQYIFGGARGVVDAFLRSEGIVVREGDGR